MEEKPSKQSEGGKARAEKLTPEQRKAIAADAAAVRWGTKAMQATHKGNFKEDFGIDAECYVLDDQTKTAVISQRGMARTLELPSGGAALPRFLTTKAIAPLVGAELSAKLAQPLKFQWTNVGAEQPKINLYGFDVTVLIDVCKVIVQAEANGVLGKRNAKVAAQAHVILGASAKAGIKNLVYALAGYNPSAAEVIAAFKLYVQEEAKKYEKEFPPELYAHWYRLFQIPVVVGRGRPWQFKYLTVNHIYYPLAKSNGKILELIRAMKAKGGDRRVKLFQFLNEIGARALSRQMGRVLEMAEDSQDRQTYERKALERFGGQPELDFSVPESTTED